MSVSEFPLLGSGLGSKGVLTDSYNPGTSLTKAPPSTRNILDIKFVSVTLKP